MKMGKVPQNMNRAMFYRCEYASVVRYVVFKVCQIKENERITAKEIAQKF